MKTRLTRQGLRDLNDPGHNGRPRNIRYGFWGRPRHDVEEVYDDFGRPRGRRCMRCRMWDPAGDYCSP